ncbi:MAG: hypothetical protein ACK5LH_06965 [Akkermansiaceae bacterium]|jgi:hypothetical protein
MNRRYSSVLRYLRGGSTFHDAARLAGISRQAIWKRMKAYPEFADAVAMEREVGKDVRTYHIWLRHPFRGKRPPTGKGHGKKPRFNYIGF